MNDDVKRLVCRALPKGSTTPNNYRSGNFCPALPILESVKAKTDE